MTDDQVTKQERARQVSEALEGFCHAYGVRLMSLVGGGVGAYADHEGQSVRLFTFGMIGYSEVTADEVEIDQ